MSEEQIRLACFELTLTGNNPKGLPSDRAAAYVMWVAGSEIKLGCLQLASKSHGNLARIGVDRLIVEAQKILDFVVPPRITSVPARKRGRPRKN